jgi:mono/diheme cytochrome c family protein
MDTIKRLILLLSCPMFFLLICCASRKKTEYNFPEQMLPHVKVEYQKQCDRGQVLYNINCAKCHTTKVRGKKIIPDFSPGQLVGYALRVTNSRHEQSLTDTTVTEEELALIMTFLSYKKKNNMSAPK